MAIRFPDVNDNLTMNAAARITLPNAACAKPAATGSVTLFFVEFFDAFPSNANHHILNKLTGLVGNTGGRISVNASGTAINFSVWGTSSAVLADTGIAGLTPNRRYLVMLISTSAHTHLVACVPGQSPIINTLTGNVALYNATFTGSTPMWNGVGGGTGVGSVRAYPGPFEELNFYHGDFPEVAGAPDTTLIQNIANGTQSLTTLHSLLAGGSHRCRYRFKDATDLADAVGGNSAGTVINDDPASGRKIYSYGPLRPVNFTPDFSADMVANCIFSTPGDMATAKTTIRTVGGAYSGMTPLRIEAKLLMENQTDRVGWTTVDAAPAAGRWTAKADTFVDVPMTVGFLQIKYRAIASDGTTVLAESPAYDLTGAGFSFVVDGQSQITRLMLLGGSNRQLTTQTRAIGAYQVSGAPPPRRQVLGATSVASTVNDTAGGGVRSAFLEFNARFPGVPVQWIMIGQEGTPIEAAYDPTVEPPEKRYYLRAAAFKASCGGMLQKFVMVYFGHSSNADTTYASKLGNAVAWFESQMGVSQINVHIPVSRLANASGTDEQNTGLQANTVWVSREQARAYCAANPTRHKWFGNLSTVWSTQDPSGTLEDAHAKVDSDSGDGRTGATVAWAVMSVSRAVADEPLALTRVRAEGATAVLEFERVNA